MKSVLLCMVLLLAITVAARAQNGGQLHTNQVVSVSNYGYSTGSYKLKITNKTECATSYTITLNGKHTTVGPVSANSVLNYELISETGDCTIRIQVKPIGQPCTTGADQGQVEAKCMEGPDIIPLPIKFTQFIIRKKQI